VVEEYRKKHARTGADNSMASFNREKKLILFVEDQEDAWEILESRAPVGYSLRV
jgi:hypothetical protein